jgi:hypothetical protein
MADNATRLAFPKSPNQRQDLASGLIEKVVAAACAGDIKRRSRLGLLASPAKLLIPVGTSFTDFSDVHG